MRVVRQMMMLAAVAGLQLGLAAGASAQQGEPIRVEELRQNPDQFRNDVVTVEGRVTQYVEQPGATNFYYVQDDWGGLIQVRTTGDQPETGRRYRIRGAVSFTQDAEPYISEDTRTPLDGRTVEEPPTEGEDEPGDGGGNGTTADEGQVLSLLTTAGPWWTQPWVIGLAALVLLAGAYYSARTRQRPAASPSSSAGAPGASGGAPAGAADREPVTPGREQEPEPTEVIHGETVKFDAPPPGTLQLLPGKLELVSGDEEVDEVRFHDPGRKETPTFTFGRESGPQYTHVQLSSPTVSREHAEITFEEDGPVITNLSTTNPTRVNQVELGEKGASAPLEDGDTIDMGEVRFRYREA